jgi:hypothetical protein
MDRPSIINRGCGVTAYDRADALNILQATVFAETSMPEIVEVIEDVDVRTLDQGHVIPKMGVVVERGVWFPRGYQSSAWPKTYRDRP